MLPALTQEAIDYSHSIYKYDDGIIFKLPGSGEKKNDCGAPVFIGHLSDGSIHYLHRSKSCHRKECPVCWKDWQKREALAIDDRIKYYFTHGYSKRRMPVHYVVSPPQNVNYDTRAFYNALKARAYKIAKQRGIDGGSLIFHERSKRYSDSEEYRIIHCSEGPHFHIIGDGWLNSRIAEFYLEDGWIVKNLRIRSFGSVYKTAYYILDHAAIGYPAYSHSTNLSMASVTWFGKMAYNKLKIQKYTGSDDIYCPICKTEISKNEWYILDWIGDGDPPDQKFGEAKEGLQGFHVSRSLTEWSGFYD